MTIFLVITTVKRYYDVISNEHAYICYFKWSEKLLAFKIFDYVVTAGYLKICNVSYIQW